MRRSIITLLALLFVCAVVHAQDTAYVQEPKKAKEPFPWKDRLYFGGAIGLNFGTVTAVQLDPIVGLSLDAKHKFSVGFGPSYYYYKYNDVPHSTGYSGYGYRLFSRYRVIEQAFLHAEFYHLNIERYNSRDQLVRMWVPHILVGGGYSERIGGSASLYFQILFEILQSRATSPVPARCRRD